jgi:LysR family transcriptional regulator, positive regulator for ilvC
VPEIDDIRLALASRNASSFGAVARSAHVSQSTVSRAVQRIELELGRSLFFREGRSVRPAADSAPLFDQLQDVLNTWDQLIVRARTDGTRELRVFCTVTASQLIAPPLFERFRQARPDVMVDLRTGSAGAALELVLTDAVDVAIAPLPQRLPAGVISTPLQRTVFVAVAPRSIKSLAGQALLVSRQGLLRELSERWIKRNLGSDVELREAETNEEVLALAAMGGGVALVPKLVVDASPLKNRVHQLSVPVALPDIVVGLAAKRRAVSSDPLADLWALA